MDFSDRPRDIADPWYTGDFDAAYDDILEGCSALLEYVLRHDQSRFYSSIGNTVLC